MSARKYYEFFKLVIDHSGIWLRINYELIYGMTDKQIAYLSPSEKALVEVCVKQVNSGSLVDLPVASTGEMLKMDAGWLVINISQNQLCDRVVAHFSCSGDNLSLEYQIDLSEALDPTANSD